MATLHLVFGVLAGIGLLAVAVAAAARLLGRSGVLILDRVILAALGAVTVAALTGLASALTDRGPADPLHLLYGLLALAAVPVARAAGVGGGDARVGRSVLIGALVALGSVVRLFMTGG